MRLSVHRAAPPTCPSLALRMELRNPNQEMNARNEYPNRSQAPTVGAMPAPAGDAWPSPTADRSVGKRPPPFCPPVTHVACIKTDFVLSPSGVGPPRRFPSASRISWCKTREYCSAHVGPPGSRQYARIQQTSRSPQPPRLEPPHFRPRTNLCDGALPLR